MKPPRTANQLLEHLDQDFAWRLQEIASIRKAIRNASGRNQATLLRAAVPLLYAHWEGFVKTAAFRYAAYISGLGITFREARKSFSGLKALSYVKQLHPINKRIFVASQLLAALHSVENEKVCDFVGTLHHERRQFELRHFRADRRISFVRCIILRCEKATDRRISFGNT